MSEVKLVKIDKVVIGYDSDNYTTISRIVRHYDELMSPDGDMVEGIPVLTSNQLATVAQRGRYWMIELEIDSDNITAFRTQDVVSGATTATAWRETSDNPAIDYFVVSGTDSAGDTKSFTYETDRVYLVGARGRVSNEPGVELHTSTYKFICIGNRTRGSTSITGSDSTSESYTGIQKCTVNGTDIDNAYIYEWEYVGVDGGDIVVPRFTPNTYEAVGVTEYPGKHYVVRITMDSYDTTWYGSLINDDGSNAALSSFSVTLNKAGGGTRVHTYEASKVWVRRHPATETIDGALRNTGQVELICIGTRVDS